MARSDNFRILHPSVQVWPPDITCESTACPPLLFWISRRSHRGRHPRLPKTPQTAIFQRSATWLTLLLYKVSSCLTRDHTKWNHQENLIQRIFFSKTNCIYIWIWSSCADNGAGTGSSQHRRGMVHGSLPWDLPHGAVLPIPLWRSTRHPSLQLQC